MLVVVQVMLGILGHEFTWVSAALAVPGCSAWLSTPVVGYGLRPQLPLSSLEARTAAQYESPLPSPPTGTVGVADRPTDRGNGGDRGTAGLAVAGQPGAGSYSVMDMGYLDARRGAHV